MPCNSDYMNPSHNEIQISKVMTFIEELDGLRLDDSEFKSRLAGYHLKCYSTGLGNNKKKVDQLVANLCAKLTKMTPEEIRNHSLELQIWWRDHQAADVIRTKKKKKLTAKQISDEIAGAIGVQLKEVDYKALMKIINKMRKENIE